MDYTRFINNISANDTYHGKFLLHYIDPKTLDEELRLYRFADFIKIARKDLKEYENFELKDNILYNFQMYIHSPDKYKVKQNIRQHSTTMTILYRITGGHNILIKKGDKIDILIYDYTRFKDAIIKRPLIVNNPKELFKFKENDIIRVLENINGRKVLTVVKSYEVPYFNFSTNDIVPTDRWRVPKELQTTMHHSISYIIGRNLFYKFPDDVRNQSINFAVYIYDHDKFMNGKHSSNEYNISENIEANLNYSNEVENDRNDSFHRSSGLKSDSFHRSSGFRNDNSHRSFGLRNGNIMIQDKVLTYYDRKYKPLQNKNAVYHKCMIDPEKSKYLDHYNGKCCVGSKYATITTGIKSIIEDLNISLKTINHYYFNEDFDKYDLDKYPSLRELKKICGIQKHLRSSFMAQNTMLIKYIDGLTVDSLKKI